MENFENFFLFFMFLAGIILGSGFMYFYYTKVNDDDNGDYGVLRDDFEVTKLVINTSTIAFADGNSATTKIIPIKEGDQIVIQPYEDRLVVALYEPASNSDDDDDYDYDD